MYKLLTVIAIYILAIPRGFGYEPWHFTIDFQAEMLTTTQQFIDIELSGKYPVRNGKDISTTAKKLRKENRGAKPSLPIIPYPKPTMDLLEDFINILVILRSRIESTSFRDFNEFINSKHRVYRPEATTRFNESTIAAYVSSLMHLNYLACIQIKCEDETEAPVYVIVKGSKLDLACIAYWSQAVPKAPVIEQVAEPQDSNEHGKREREDAPKVVEPLMKHSKSE
jgi:hypothetical protein